MAKLVKLTTSRIRCDRWMGVARPAAWDEDLKLLSNPREGLAWIVYESNTGLTLEGYGLPVDWVTAVHWTAATNAGEWVFFKGHGALGGDHYVRPLYRPRDWLAEIAAGHVGAPSFEDGFRFLSSDEWRDIARHEGSPAWSADHEMLVRLQEQAILDGLIARGFGYAASDAAMRRLMIRLCRAYYHPHFWRVDADDCSYIVGSIHHKKDLYFQVANRDIYIGPAEFWRSSEMDRMRETIPEQLRARWFGSE